MDQFDLISWFGNQGQGLWLKQSMVGIKGCLMERGRWGQYGGMQRGKWDWSREKRWWMTAWGTNGERNTWLSRGSGGGGGSRGGGGSGRRSRSRGLALQREVVGPPLRFGCEGQGLGLLRVSGCRRGWGCQGGRGRGWGVQHAAMRGGGAVAHLLRR